MKARWIMLGLGILVIAGWFICDGAQKPTIHFLGYLPPPYETDNIGGVPTFVIRNDTQHAFSTYGDERLFRFVSDSGKREVRECMNCTGAYYRTIFPGQTVQLHESAPQMNSGERYALGIRLYRGTAASLSAPSFLDRWIPWSWRQPTPTWSGLVSQQP